MLGSATLADASGRFATAATRMRAARTRPWRSGAADTSWVAAPPDVEAGTSTSSPGPPSSEPAAWRQAKSAAQPVGKLVLFAAGGREPRRAVEDRLTVRGAT